MSDVTTEKRGPGRPPKPRDEFGNIIREGSAPEFASPAEAIPTSESGARPAPAESEPAPSPTPEPEAKVVTASVAPESFVNAQATPVTAEMIEAATDLPLKADPLSMALVADDWVSVIVAGIEHFAARPGEHQQEALAMMAIHRTFAGARHGPTSPHITECTACGDYRCEGIPDSPTCPTCGAPFPVWEERT